MEPFITQLTPLSFLRRSADVYPEKVAVIYGDMTLTYRELAEAVELRAHAFRAAGVVPGDRVAYLMPNVPEMLIAHYAVPLAGAVLVAINTRLSGEEIRYIVDHSQSVMLVLDSALTDSIADVAAEFETVKSLVIVADSGRQTTTGLAGAQELQDLLLRVPCADKLPLEWAVDDEKSLISINYTSGTTGKPKGVMYSHRGAYLNSLGELIHSKHHAESVYLWTLPMFHCNGWSTGWALAAAGGTQICLREVRGDEIWNIIDRHGVTHLNGAPTVLISILNSNRAHALDRCVVATTAGAPPSPSTIERVKDMGFELVHVYGLTETYGPYSVCEPQNSWRSLDASTQANLMARQGVGMVQNERMRVVFTTGSEEELVDVPADGQTMGEILMRGNNVMTGYFRNAEATQAAFRGGWFHSGDLGVMHPDGYVELRDRAKDIIISGGENISTIEVEQALMSHPAVIEAAVVGVPDDRWGERPKAFVVPSVPDGVTEAELIEHVRTRIARYKAPREIVLVTDLPKTSTGKIRKLELREPAWSEHRARIN
ncbi:long-chain-fatty-acid--CoA ligase [Arthrobacter sp. OAP107]|uniref:long-chain-fatty-acid--CoA ligase n=1 Tax=Arthrobacter sp. OAP107 TaxID=3156445 RepID=UPI003399F2DD